jgi:hypothetical protein
MVFKVKNKYKGSLSLLQLSSIVLLGIALCLVAFFIYSNFLILLSTILSILVLIFYFLSKPEEVNFEIKEDCFIYQNRKALWFETVGWAVVDLDEKFEFIIQTSNFNVNFHYFYLTKEDPQVRQIVSALTQFAPYNQEIIELDKIHWVLRNLDLV